jgi:hypothetical protein
MKVALGYTLLFALILTNFMANIIIDFRTEQTSIITVIMGKFMLLFSVSLYLELIRRVSSRVTLDNKVQTWLIVYAMYILFILIRDVISLDIRSVSTFVLHEYTLPFAILPFAIYLGYDKKIVKYLIQPNILLLTVSIIVITLLYANNLMIQRSYGYIILIYLAYITSRDSNVFLVIIIGLLMYSYLHYGNRAILGFTIILIAYKHVPLKKSIRYVLIPLVMLASLYSVIMYQELLLYIGSYFSIDETDNRSFLYLEMFSELNIIEVLTGRGLMGTYFSQYFLDIKYFSQVDRFSVEVGLLQYILKLGLIAYIFVLYISLLATYRGVMSGSVVKLNLSVYILFVTVFQLVAFRPLFDIFWIVNWIVIGYLLNNDTINTPK